MEPAAFESVSTWSQPPPPVGSPARRALLDEIANEVIAVRPGRIRVAIDGRTASGKTSFGHELASAVRSRGRPTLRASLDDFKHPWRDAVEKGYDRTSGDGYYRNAPDFDSARDLLLRPAGPDGTGEVALCAHDPLTGEDHRDRLVVAPPNAVLIVDTVFALRPAYEEFWDLSVWLEIPAGLSLDRGVARDAELEGRAEAEALHRDRYHEAERLYIAEVEPRDRATVVIDNADFDAPIRLR